MIAGANRGLVCGFTTNPPRSSTTLRSPTEPFAPIAAIPDLPISLEVLPDDFGSMGRQAREITSGGGNTYVKSPSPTRARMRSFAWNSEDFL
jgi:hypothetical protein